ncbi:MAG: hypothetical protein EA383_16765 [Spirochaetaceae bacterium]|nr:MAG: hypothetical protein EA383_16765 [Spirochaetaceae bacterium]
MRFRRCVLSLVILVAIGPAALRISAFEDIDDMFDDPDQGIIEDDDDAPDSDGADKGEDDAPARPQRPAVGGIDLEALTTSPTSFSGSVSAGLGAGISLLEWPWDGGDVDSVSDYVDWIAGYSMSSTVRVDSRPRGHIRFSGALSTSLNPASMSFSNPSVSTLFIDYTLADTVLFRLGRFSTTWGQGRILGNPANFVSEVSGGAAVRATVPVARGTATGIVFSQGSWVGDGDGQFDASDPRAFAYAGQFETTIGSVATGISLRRRVTEPWKTSVHATAGFGDVDVTVEATNSWGFTAPFVPEAEEFSLNLLTQVAWTGGDPAWVVGLEHRYDTTVPDFMGHRFGTVVRMPQVSFLGNRWRPNLQWRHAIEDHSGDVTAGLSATVARDLSLSIGLPVRYGPPSSVYRTGSLNLGTAGDIDGVAAVGFVAQVSFSY